MLLAKIVTLALTLSLFAVSATLAEPVSIKFSQIENRNTPRGKASEYFKRLVEQRSNKRIKVEFYAANGLLDESKELDELKSNWIQMSAPSWTRLTDINPQLLLFDLPFLFADTEHLHRVLDGTIGKEILAKTSREGLVALAFWDNGSKQLTANRPLILPQDAAGLKFGLTGSEVDREQFRILGASGQVTPLEQRYETLKKGEIDGQESTLSDVYNQELYRVQSNLTLSNHGYLGYLVMTNSHFWDQLPKDLKVIILGAIRDAGEYSRELAVQLHNDTLEKIRSTRTIRVRQLTATEKELWKNRLQHIYPAFYGKVGRKLITDIAKEEP